MNVIEYQAIVSHAIQAHYTIGTVIYIKWLVTYYIPRVCYEKKMSANSTSLYEIH